MNRADACQPWFGSAYSELLCHFAVDEQFPSLFSSQTAFHTIMAAELAAKCLLIFCSSQLYASLEGDRAKQEIQRIAKSQGHHLDGLLTEISTTKQNPPIQNFLQSHLIVPGVEGLCMTVADFIREVVKPAYLETRYPMPHRISDRFDGFLPHFGSHIPDLARELLKHCVELFRQSNDNFSVVWTSLKRFTTDDLRVRFLRHTIGLEVADLDGLIDAG